MTDSGPHEPVTDARRSETDPRGNPPRALRLHPTTHEHPRAQRAAERSEQGVGGPGGLCPTGARDRSLAFLLKVGGELVELLAAGSQRDVEATRALHVQVRVALPGVAHAAVVLDVVGRVLQVGARRQRLRDRDLEVRRRRRASRTATAA